MRPLPENDPTNPFLGELDLGNLGAPDFSLRDRLDFSGHSRKTPHVNSDLINNMGDTPMQLRREGGADFRDLTENQLPGFNGMQKGGPKSPF